MGADLDVAQAGTCYPCFCDCLQLLVIACDCRHWNTWGSVKSPGPDAYMKLGASEFPALTRRLREIAAIIAKKHAADV